MLADRRDSRRLEPFEGRDAATILHRGKAEVAILINVSSEGFRVSAPKGRRFRVGDVMQLNTCDGHHVVRIENVCEGDGRLCLGLKRLHSAPLAEPGNAARKIALGRGLWRRTVAAGMSLLAYVVLPLSIAAALILFATGADGLAKISHMVLLQVGL